jgi:hypothetical protein
VVRSTGADVQINGTTNVGGTFYGNASSGSIIEGASGVLLVGSTSTFNSSNSFGINLSNSGNSFGGAVEVRNGLTNVIVASSNITIASGTCVTAGNSNLTVTSTGSSITTSGEVSRLIAVSSGNIIVSGGNHSANLTLTAADPSANSITQTSAATRVNGTLTLNSQGNVTLNTVSNNLTGPVVLSNVVRDTTVYSARDIANLSGTSTGNVTVAAGTSVPPSSTNTFSNPWGIVLGNLNVASLTASTYNGNTALGALGNATAGNSGSITQQAGASLHVENTADLYTFNGNVVLGNNNNSFGRIQVSTGGAVLGSSGQADVTIVEDSTLKIGNLTTTGNATLTSRFGSIIEDPITSVVLTANGTSSVVNFSAPSGSVQLGGVSRTSGTTTGNIIAANVTAAGTAQLLSSGNITLGATSANSLTVTGNNIAQSAPLNIFGLSTFNATNAITLTNVDNNFGPLSLNTTSLNQNIAVTEGNTLNVRTVSMPGGGNGTLSLTSVNGDLIDTGLGGARFGGNLTNAGTGVVSLLATNGNITIDDPTSDVLTSGGVLFSGKNVTISVLGNTGSNLVLGAASGPSSASGNFTASSALGNIANAGSLSVSGSAFLQTGTGNISITVPSGGSVGFGTLRFAGNQVSIQESGNMDILTGSTAFGPANLVSGGSIAIVDVGGGPVTFGNTVNMAATGGSITLRLVQAVGQLAVTASGTKDLSALSLSTDLNNKTPIYGGGGSNVEPKP